MTRNLSADCANCFGLCCVALPFTASADFAIDKPAGRPCPNLAVDFGCGIHSRLLPSGFSGCVAYDCFGAGQHVAQHTFGGSSWRDEPANAAQMFAVFSVVRQLHELLHHLADALRRPAAAPLHASLRQVYGEVADLADATPEDILAAELTARRTVVADLLGRASLLVRAEVASRRDLRRADLVGARLRGADLRGADLRGALLIAADLRGADLRLADLLGTDLRDADLRGTRLDDSLYLSAGQLGAARGDAATVVGPSLTRPARWAATTP